MILRRQPRLNHGGNSTDNPVLDGMALTLKLHKQDASELLRQVWVTVGKVVHAKLTPLAIESRFDVTINIVAGIELQAADPAVKNIIHFTTSEHRHVSVIVYCATKPPALITLDGYNADDFTKPLIFPFFLAGG